MSDVKMLIAGLSALIAADLAASPSLAAQAANPPTAGETAPEGSNDTWNDLRFDIVGERELMDGAKLFTIDAPYRAEDAATVPIVIQRAAMTTGGPITGLKLVIDENPSPVAADIQFGPSMTPLRFETRIRVNQYSNVRIIAETPDGAFMNARFVKASGGCSAPASKDPVAALKGMGEMRARVFDDTADASKTRREAQIMIRHPNYSGLQRDQVTHLFIGAHFINKLEVRQGDDVLFTLVGGISISENPVFRFAYQDDGSADFIVHAEDTKGNVFDQTLPKRPRS